MVRHVEKFKTKIVIELNYFESVLSCLSVRDHVKGGIDNICMKSVIDPEIRSMPIVVYYDYLWNSI